MIPFPTPPALFSLPNYIYISKEIFIFDHQRVNRPFLRKAIVLEWITFCGIKGCQRVALELDRLTGIRGAKRVTLTKIEQKPNGQRAGCLCLSPFGLANGLCRLESSIK